MRRGHRGSARGPKPTTCPKCGAAGYVIHRLEPGPPRGRRGRDGPRRRTEPNLLLPHFKSIKPVFDVLKALSRVKT